MSKPSIHGVLFDLDGTLLDTAPDLTHAANRVLAEFGRPPLSEEVGRALSSHGSVGLLNAGFNGDISEEQFEQGRTRFFDLYEKVLSRHTRVFDGIETMLATLESNGIAWGIVTNKPARFTDPLLEQFACMKGCGVAISADTLPVRKPDPAPLYYAAGALKVDPTRCIYLGDAERDIEAGNRANMLSLIANWGYIGETDTPEQWQARAGIDHPMDLLDWLNR